MSATKITLLRHKPKDYPRHTIDEIVADEVGITIRQTDKHAIGFRIRERGSVRRFRFVSVTPGKGTGVCLEWRYTRPHGAYLMRPGYPDEIAAYDLSRANIHIERMTRNEYSILVRGADDSGGGLQAVTRGADGGIALVEVVRAD